MSLCRHFHIVFAVFMAAQCAASGQSVLLDFGNDLSFRGADTPSPDGNGNSWNSVWSGDFYQNLVNASGGATTIDLGFDAAAGNDSFNGPAGTSTNPADAIYDAPALGDLGVDQAVFDYYVSSNFQLQQLDPSKTYDLTFYGSHKFNNDDVTRYSLYADNTYGSPIASVDLAVGSGSSHNQSNVVTLSGVSPQADSNFYVGFSGASGGNGYLNAMQITETPPAQPAGPKVYMHYMPWFDAPETLGPGNWGLHWRNTRGNTTDPNIVDSTGKREIASNYYPMIGPYESSNTDVIEYHMLLMKLSGIDGVLIDWYGVQGANGDVGSLLENSNAIVNEVGNYGLEFGVVLEDRFSTFGINGAADISKAEANVAYLRDNYFNRPEYIRAGENNDPILPVFGPITFDQESEWTQILAQAGGDVEFLPLWYQGGDGGANSDGEHAWIFEDEALDDYESRLDDFYANRAPFLDTAGGAAYPGFDVFGGADFIIPHDNGQVLANTLALAEQYESDIDFLQLATFNDFGEGTIFEPTIEAGFSYLEQVQDYTGVPFDEEDLELVYRLYMARQEYAGNPTIQASLNFVATAINSLDLDSAAAFLAIAAPAGDYDGDGQVDLDDLLVWQNTYGSQTVLRGSGADGNFDGVIDAADFTIWRDNYQSLLEAATGGAIPEPSSAALLSLLPILGAARRRAIRRG